MEIRKRVRSKRVKLVMKNKLKRCGRKKKRVNKKEIKSKNSKRIIRK